jgi:hypothetical protein
MVRAAVTIFGGVGVCVVMLFIVKWTMIAYDRWASSRARAEQRERLSEAWATIVAMTESLGGQIRDIPPTTSVCVIDEGDVRRTYTRTAYDITEIVTVLMINENGCYADVPANRESAYSVLGWRRASDPEPAPVTTRTRAISFEE